MIEIIPLAGIGEVAPGTDIAGLLAQALRYAELTPGADDILVVTQKIISKAENCFIDLRTVTPGDEARRLAAITGKDPRLVELVLAESTAVLRAAPNVLITRHRTGHVMANAGIDRSNLGPAGDDVVLLLPRDADASAMRLSHGLRQRNALASAVVISDSFGRPWRYGVVNVAIGAYGFPALLDQRGQPDRNFRPLEVTQIALADMIASAAGLAMGEGAEGIPAVLVRGFHLPPGAVPAAALVRALKEDLFQ